MTRPPSAGERVRLVPHPAGVSTVTTVTTMIEPIVRTTTISKTATTDWLTAIAACFAAIGTVGAVAVALWQSSQAARRDRRRVQMRMAGVLASDPPPRVMVKITNESFRPVRFEFPPYLVARRPDGTRIALGAQPTEEESSHLPRTIGDGETLIFVWNSYDIRDESIRNGTLQPLFAHAHDALDNHFECPYPGVNKVRKQRWNPFSAKDYETPTVFIGPPLREGETLDEINRRLKEARGEPG